MNVGKYSVASQLFSLVLLFAPTLPIASALYAQSTGKGTAKANDLEDATFKFKINPRVPGLRFRVFFEPNDSNDEDIRPSVRSIEVFRGASNRPLQTLTGCDYSDSGGVHREGNWFSAEDVDFDGYRDISLMNWDGRNASGCVWLYNLVVGRFEYSEEFTKLGNFTLDPKTKSIYTFGSSGGGNYGQAKYTVVNHRPIEIWMKYHGYDIKKQQYRCVMKRRRGDKLVVVHSRWEDPDGDKDPLCDEMLVPVPLK